MAPQIVDIDLNTAEVVTTDQIAELLLALITPFIKGINLSGPPTFRKSLTSEEVERLFDGIYNIIREIKE